MARPDLQALDDAALAMLANRGLLKRARRELDRGEGPAVEVAVDGTVTGTFADGTVTTLPPDTALRATSCTCDASRVCRHRVATVLAFQASAAGDASGERAPMRIDDAALRTRLGAKVFAAAERSRTGGYSATVRIADAVPPVVLLPTCTVTFLVPWDLAHARCDCVVGVDCEHVAMAVWALAAAGDADGERLVGIGGTERRAEAREADAVASLQALQLELVANGWSGPLEELERRLGPVRHAIGRGGMVWLEDLVESLAGALREHQAGIAGADVEAVARLLTELDLRCRAAPSERAPRAYLYGEGTSGETRLDHVVLRGLGARYRVSGRIGRLSVFLREAGSDDALALERDFVVDEGARPPPGPVIASRRLLGSAVGLIATGSVTTHGARRRPNRVIDVSAQRLQTSVMPGTGKRLEAPADYGTVRARLSARVPQALAPRVRAWQVAALGWGRVIDAGYDPGAHSVWGELADDDDARLHVLCEWTPEAPGGPAVLARALVDGADFITGEAFLRRGQLWLRPLTIGLAEGPVVLDLAADGEMAALPTRPIPAPPTALAEQLHGVRSWLAEISRRGVRHLTARQAETGRGLVARLRASGFLELGAALDALLDAPDPHRWNLAAARTTLLEHALARAD